MLAPHSNTADLEMIASTKRLSDAYYASLLSQSGRERKPSPICSLYPLERAPGIISLLAGKPNPTTFPITSLTFSARSPYSSSPADETTYSLTPGELALGLQYADAAGIKPFLEWCYGLQEISHGRKKGEGWSVFVGVGSLDLIYKAIHALVDYGDPVLIESPTYSGVLSIFQNLHCNLVDVETDSQGISAASLRSILENWPTEKPPAESICGNNPTGVTATLERRVEVLKLAHEFDFIILEDDPYYYLYYGSELRPPSYFSLEKQILPETGRVLRFDSLSKVFSAGMRLGFASGPEPILTAIGIHTETSTSQTSSLTQMIAYKVLSSWGYDGFKIHTKRLSDFYREKRDVYQAAMMKYLDGYVEWTQPEAGMFFWFKLKLSNDRDEANDSESAIRGTAFKNGVLALPGTVFLPNGSKTAYVRASFSLNTEEEVFEGLRRLRASIIEARGDSEEIVRPRAEF
ncbi:hypothetical protein NP233_g7312 [Leucocoprinus birnbaumii]|uniref:Aminotransferase class I/classII large domain-containing protein n=1 Tax=Leucocoprinus birnbaumii TaxID=56174 RepID=A0AAD5VPH5_9AGAR|nr:hypothetical protein NP233_g7312 [Leucocoprinus birnbaumii]